ncbi:MAG: hypothetical protein A2Y77_14620 [Planctomycetes bacterium RBG_13_62_9]|nr:MAG: hypothetical protein A2Y77_14620 [Planctomycetes bacterium RBG_13_62_9]
MAKIDIKELLKKLSFLKNNLALLVPILITVVALLLFIPTKILGGRLRKTVQQSVQTARTIEDLGGQVEEAARAKQMEPYMAAYARDANQIEIMMKQATMRELLTYRIFPDTSERTQLLFEEFKYNYLSGMDALLESVRGGTAPTMGDIQQAWKNAPKTMYGDAYGGMYGQGQMMPSNMMMEPSLYGRGQGFSTMGMSETQRKIMDTVCQEKARAASVYAGPMDMAGYLYWTDWKFVDHNDATRDCWYWQLGYWIIEDVMGTIREMNKEATSVLDARVKRLMNVNFVLGRMAGRSMRRSTPYGRPLGGIGTGAGAKENPTYVTSAKDAMTAPCTGRFCGEEFDVVHFNVRVVVEARDVMAFMKQLCTAKTHEFKGWKGNEPVQTYAHNQISILESSTAPINAETYDHYLYRYGDAPVVELDLICEYVFDKPTYEGMKPKVVQQDIIDATTKTTGRR